jgi:hypothetical protein
MTVAHAQVEASASLATVLPVYSNQIALPEVNVTSRPLSALVLRAPV